MRRRDVLKYESKVPCIFSTTVQGTVTCSCWMRGTFEYFVAVFAHKLLDKFVAHMVGELYMIWTGALRTARLCINQNKVVDYS